MANTRRAEPASSSAALPSCPTPAVRVRHLCRSFSSNSRRRPNADIAALTDVNLEVRAEEVHGLLGPNGAGKTTLCRILATVLLPTAGSAEVFGFDVVTHVHEVRRRIGIVFGGDRGLYPRLSARQNLHFWAALYGVPRPARPSLAERLLTRVGLGERAEERVERYSRGMRQRLHLARALVGNPQLLLLDEPTTAMDPVAALEFRSLVGELRGEGRTILLATHNMAEAERLCDRVTLIDGGGVVATERPGALAARFRYGYRIEADDVPEFVAAALAGIPNVRVLVTQAPGRLRVEADAAAVPAVTRRLLDAGVTALRVGPPDLEEAYLCLVGDRGMMVPR